MRITVIEAKYGISPMLIESETTEQWNSVDEAVTAKEKRLLDEGHQWAKTALPSVVVLDVDDPPQETILWIVDTDACEKVWGMPIKEAISRMVAARGGGVLELGPERTLKVRPLTVTPDHIRALMATTPLVLLTNDALNDLSQALGGAEMALEFLVGQATEHNKPVAVNIRDPNGSDTIFLSPEGWTEERLKGWVGTHKAAIEAEFGEVQGPPSRAPSRKERRKKRPK